MKESPVPGIPLKTTFPDCMSLDELPYFIKDEFGRLKLDPALGLRIIDAHTHIGLSYFFRGKIDLWKKTPEVFHNFPARGNPIDLQNYGHSDLTPENLKIMQRDLVNACFLGSVRARSQTIPNLLTEMDDFCVSHCAVLSIEVRFMFSNNYVIFENLKNEDRLIPFCCVHPSRGRVEERLDQWIEAGARGLKFHPVFMTIAPDDERALSLFRLCAQRGLPIISHTSASGSEPAYCGKFGRLEPFEKAIQAAEGVPFILGHSGMMNEWKTAIDFASRYDNTYLETSGQPIHVLHEMFARVPHHRILHGTDWPFYPMSLQLAKTLVATEGNDALRDKILYGNMAKILGIE
ncbi:amidohydrolase family protein [bacterium]